LAKIYINLQIAKNYFVFISILAVVSLFYPQNTMFVVGKTILIGGTAQFCATINKGKIYV